MTFIGKGNTGQVFRPPLECGSCRSDNLHVGKIYAFEFDYQSELDIHQNLISGMDPDGYFTPSLLGECFEPPMMQLCFSYAGDVLTDKNFHAQMITKEALPVFYGLTVLAKYGYCHLDLRESNVTYNDVQNKIMLIDFNSMEAFKDVYHPVNKNIISAVMYHSPPEFIIANHVMFQKKSTIPEADTYMDLIGDDIVYTAGKCFMGSMLTSDFLRKDYTDMIQKHSFVEIKKESLHKIDLYMLGMLFLLLLSRRGEAPPKKVARLLLQMIRPNVFERIDPFRLYQRVTGKK